MDLQRLLKLREAKYRASIAYHQAGVAYCRAALADAPPEQLQLLYQRCPDAGLLYVTGLLQICTGKRHSV
jgi:hypothetical protein